MAKVSIILPTHNRGHVIPDAIRSVLEQTHRDFELLIVDDASDDDTQEKVQAFDDTRIQYHRVPRGGVSRARNFALERVAGDYVAFIDSDDLYLPRKLEAQVAFLEANPQVMVAYSPYVEVHRGKETFHSCRQKGQRVFLEMFKGSFVNVNSILVRREAAAAVGGFPEDFTTLEDFDFFLRLAEKYPFGFVEETSSVYRMSDRDEGGDIDRYLHYLEFVKGCRDRFEPLRKNPRAWRWKYGKVLFGLGKSYFRAGDYAEAERRIRESLANRWQPDAWLFYRKCKKKLKT